MKKTYLILTLFFVLFVTTLIVVGTFGSIAQNIVSITGQFVADQENRLTFTPVKTKFVRLEFQRTTSSPANVGLHNSYRNRI